ncbi:MAG: glutamyl-tRNA reductase [Candidatus Aquicultor secundus]|uniref:Glutamyl-tRNA reductase n=1 Tax=Candidatus Aquicultor secundus TaxID=1973895 RepID=A0A2M7TA92_9ACTN|nr:glutamyl-tRNA reductase [Candidatus Aquicultor secundus]NCO65175.1 glutamyl-tRNA reductase [Solirubrobacter sp.]OIO87134.1 MAG: glutamyl-tRNA reductase [Candidatus Aquicultor secundus]PIU27410.1 MAG: glutamyl-tRNA reductase [Candidatus Aquicultor secundus]PIW22730.1 MAG: glutamyl-tRNA reductase [Candidatus Aquicultor secundus]PIX52037.1 MAG: glutamyl-tRNA reductase [Candidatus Aquicultor secundus]
MHIIVAGLSHKTAPVEVRETVTFPEQILSDALHMLTGYPSINEAVILSTCNRMEIYVVANDPDKGKDDVIRFISDYHSLERDKLEKYLYFREGKNAILHLFRVASSLDSMVIGEAQILGQVKTAYNAAFEAEATSTVMNRLFRHGFSAGKRVRTETEIGESAVSISYAAVELAKKVFESLSGRTVMLIGAGEMIELTATHLLSNGVSNVIVTNRTYERAESLARKYNGVAVRFNDFVDQMVHADIVISSTGAPHYVVTKDHVSFVMQKRKNKPIFFIDIAVPRDIDPSAAKIYNVFAYDIDDLDSVVQTNLEERKKAATIAEEIVEHEVLSFSSWLATLEVAPTIASLRRMAEEIRQKELEKHLRKLPNLSEAELNTVNALTSAIINKLLHQPIVKAKEYSTRKDGYLYIESLKVLFNIEDEEEDEEPEGASAFVSKPEASFKINR